MRSNKDLLFYLINFIFIGIYTVLFLMFVVMIKIKYTAFLKFP